MTLSTTRSPSVLDELCINKLRFLGVDTRGLTRELVNFYEQALTQESILVAAESHGPEPSTRLAEARQILMKAGAQPVRLHGD